MHLLLRGGLGVGLVAGGLRLSRDPSGALIVYARAGLRHLISAIVDCGSTCRVEIINDVVICSGCGTWYFGYGF